jgi:hypothetical protein
MLTAAKRHLKSRKQRSGAAINKIMTVKETIRHALKPAHTMCFSSAGVETDGAFLNDFPEIDCGKASLPSRQRQVVGFSDDAHGIRNLETVYPKARPE